MSVRFLLGHADLVLEVDNVNKRGEPERMNLNVITGWIIVNEGLEKEKKKKLLFIWRCLWSDP